MSFSERPAHKQNKGHHLAFCESCDRFFDVRSGCEADIRYDERQQIEGRITSAPVHTLAPLVWREDLQNDIREWPTPAWFAIVDGKTLGPFFTRLAAENAVPALLAEPGKVRAVSGRALETHPYSPVKTEDEDGEFMVCSECGKGDLEHTDSYPYLMGKEDGAAEERSRLREKVEAMRRTVGGPGFEAAVAAYDAVLALLEPGETQP